MMSLWDALRMNMMISYQELVRTFLNITELINKAAENGYSLRVVDDRDSTETPATYASPHQLL
ncbi:TPA: hypothetical protein JLK42_001058 [Escherichia coli]|nr:hypothetical protein [Escherichia coli]HAW0793344.1 hypothetical protein [Escherichia coli]HAW1087894.1 hypothetical protein [Escherichia coli]HBN2155673.1 hypothetical protein [Escherichia coli]